MRDGQRLCNGQPQAMPCICGRIVPAMEALKHVGQILGRDPDPGIRDRQRGVFGLLNQRQADAAALRGELERIFKQVCDHAFQLLLIPVNHKGLSREFNQKNTLGLFCAGSEAFSDFTCNLGQIDGRVILPGFGRFDA